MKNSILLFLCAFMIVPAYAQQELITTIKNKLESYSKKHLTEKLYVHTDRETYLAGETLWFKIYAVDGFEHLPLDLSQVAYLELLDRENNSVVQIKTPLENSNGNGSVFLPVTINSGNYILRAYTSWMQNESPEFFFQKEVSIINTFKTLGPALPEADEAGSAKIEVFPEGGYLVSELPANLAIQVDKKMLPLKGQLIKDGLDTLQLFDFDKNGLAKISLTPDQLSDYKIAIIGPEGKKIGDKKLLVAPDGYTMHVQEANNTISLLVHSNFDVPVVNLVIHNRQKVTHARTLDFIDGRAEVRIDKATLADNVSHITIFDFAGNPVAERLYYKPGRKDLKVNINANKNTYLPREMVNLQVNTSNENNDPVNANMSMAVRQIFDFEKDDFIDIKQYIQLTSDLPSIGFDVADADGQTMDLLMLTAGWRRFTWDMVLNESKDTIQFHPELNGHIIKGKVYNRQEQTPAPYIKGYLSIPGKKAQIFGGLSDARGEIHFETIDFYQKNQIVVQTENDSLYQIIIEKPFSEEQATKRFTELNIDESDAAELNQRSIDLQVQNTYYGSKYRQLILPDQDSIAFFGEPDATYYLDDYTRFPTMEDVMREYVANVWVRKNRNGYYYLVYDMATKDIFKNSSLVLLDGVPIFDTDKIIDYDPLHVEKIELVKRKFLHGLLTCEGIVSYTTYEGNLKDFPLDPRTLIIDYEGLQARREFYAPEYGQEKPSSMPDFRTLLHWEPEINTRKGSAEISFYTSDQPGTYLIDVQGVTSNGRFGSEQKTFTVEGDEFN